LTIHLYLLAGSRKGIQTTGMSYRGSRGIVSRGSKLGYALILKNVKRGVAFGKIKILCHFLWEAFVHI